MELRFGRGFGEKNLRRMVQFSEAFPDPEIVAALLRQLGWTHFTLLIPLKEPLKREFYAEMCRVETWSTRVYLTELPPREVLRERLHAALATARARMAAGSNLQQ